MGTESNSAPKLPLSKPPATPRWPPSSASRASTPQPASPGAAALELGETWKKLLGVVKRKRMEQILFMGKRKIKRVACGKVCFMAAKAHEMCGKVCLIIQSCPLFKTKIKLRISCNVVGMGHCLIAATLDSSTDRPSFDTT